MNNDNWTDLLRDKLEEHQSPVPDGLWADIERKLDKSAAKPAAKHTVPLFRWVAAAACILLLAGAGLMFFNPVSTLPADIRVAQERQQGSHEPTGTSEQDVPATPSQRGASLVAALSPQQRMAAQAHGTDNGKADHAPLEAAETDIVALASTDQPVAVTALSDTATASQRPQPARQTAAQRPVTHREPKFTRTATSSKHKGTGWSAALYAANMMMGNASGDISSQPVLAVMSSNEMPFIPVDGLLLSGVMPRYMEDAKEKTEHKMPVSIGMTAKYHLTSRWAVSTGLVYTRLRSDFTHQSAGISMVDKQILHYIGIPLKAEYRLLKWGGLAAYVAAGGEMDKNIKASMETEGIDNDIKKDRTQWSADASVGVQYDFLPQLGVYVEPGVKYYFNNHSSLENYYKEHPWNFNLQLGLRWNINNK